MPTWTDIEAELEALRTRMPELVAEYGDDAIQAFAEVCDPILERAGEHRRHASDRATEILFEAGLIDAEGRQV